MDFVGARAADARFIIGHTQLGNIASLQDATDKEVATLLGELGGIVPRQQMREAATLLGLIAERGSQNPNSGRIDAVFQSESAGHGLIAAYTHPEAFHNIVLAFPGSLSGPQTGFIPLRIAKDGMVRRQHRPSPDNDFRPQDQLGPAASIRMQLNLGLRRMPRLCGIRRWRGCSTQSDNERAHQALLWWPDLMTKFLN